MKKLMLNIKARLAGCLLGDSVYIGKGSRIEFSDKINIDCGHLILFGEISSK